MADTAKILSCYADIMAIRHPKEGAPYVASCNASIPVINAGDGGHNHPTQTLADLLTIWRKKGGFENLTIGLCGDLKFGRTVHSLVAAMARYSGVKFVFIAPEELRIPQYVIEDELLKRGIEYKEVTDMESVMPDLDILYMTRVQKERFFNETQAGFIIAKDADIYMVFSNLSVIKCDKIAAMSDEDADMIMLSYANACREDNPEKVIKQTYAFTAGKNANISTHGFIINTKDFTFKKMEDVQ
jgi:aspartate carbamoyltransferase catalytic subunit